MAQSKAYKKGMNFVYGMGAAVVIIGALFKIQHWICLLPHCKSRTYQTNCNF